MSLTCWFALRLALNNVEKSQNFYEITNLGQRGMPKNWLLKFHYEISVSYMGIRAFIGYSPLQCLHCSYLTFSHRFHLLVSPSPLLVYSIFPSFSITFGFLHCNVPLDFTCNLLRWLLGGDWWRYCIVVVTY